MDGKAWTKWSAAQKKAYIQGRLASLEGCLAMLLLEIAPMQMVAIEDALLMAQDHIERAIGLIDPKPLEWVKF